VISRARGVIELTLSALLFGVMAYLTKQATRSLDGAQAAFVRFVVGVAVVAVHFAARRRAPVVVRRDLVFLRGAFGGVAVLLYFVTVTHLPVGTATLLVYTSPIFSATFAALFLGETLPRLRVVALVTASAGVALVIVGQGRALGGAYQWQALGLLSALCAGVAVTSIRAARQTDGSWEVFGAFCVLGLLCSAPFAIAGWQPPSGGMWLLLLAIGAVAAAGQVLMTHALATVDAATAGIISLLTVVTALALGMLLDREPLTPLSLAGAALTLVGVGVASGAPGFMRLSSMPRKG
jgi:drug/metabolite transporter (DMT)-like permease